MLEKELFNTFYEDLFNLIGEEATLAFYTHYRGLTLNVPKKLYNGKKIARKMKGKYPLDQKSKHHYAREYGYSQRQIERLLKTEKTDD